MNKEQIGQQLTDRISLIFVSSLFTNMLFDNVHFSEFESERMRLEILTLSQFFIIKSEVV